MNQREQVDKMRVTPVNKLMLKMGVPIVLSMVLQAVYNIVDSAFVSKMDQYGEEALNALTLAFPMQMLIIAVGIGTGVGVNALVSKSLGQEDYEKAARTTGNAEVMAIIIYAIFVLFGFFGTGPYISTQTDNPMIYEMATDYLFICCVGSFGTAFYTIFEKLLQSTGHSTHSTIAQISGALTNIILDPILIYGWLGLPEMGIKGAAYATIIGQFVAGLLTFIFHLAVNKSIKNGIRYLKPSAKIIGQIYAIGLPAIIAQALISIMTYILNIILISVSESMVTAYGLFYKIQQFVMFIAFGIRDAITPIVSYSHGMGSRKRIKDGVRFGIIYTLVMMLAGTIFVEVFAQSLSGMFGLSGETSELCVSAMRVVSLSFIFMGANIACQGLFQALDGGIESLIISVCRQCIFVLPTAFVFAQLAKESMDNSWLVWLSFPFAETVTAIIAVLLLIRVYKRKVSILPKEEAFAEAEEETTEAGFEAANAENQA